MGIRHFMSLASVCVIVATALSIGVSVDSLGQRTDGSGLIDIWYTLSGFGLDCVEVILTPVTASGETLTCGTFVEPSDTGTVCGFGPFHAVWDIGTDVPGREFYDDRISVHIMAARPGVDPGDCECPPAIDIDGNIYATVKIIDQCWMAENLRTTHFRSGAEIINGLDDWRGYGIGSIPARCAFNNDPAIAETYGLLYNWYAVDSPDSLAPSGWHIPTDDEWKRLERYLGMDASEVDDEFYRGTDQGSRLAGARGLWDTGPLVTNPAFGSSGFNAIPAGNRTTWGYFVDLSSGCYFWTSTDYFGGGNAWARHLNYDNTAVHRFYQDKTYGRSIRCIKD